MLGLRFTTGGRMGLQFEGRMIERVRSPWRQRWGSAIALGVLGASTFAVSSTPAKAAASPPHIMVIVEENEAYSSAQTSSPNYVIGNSNAPYINSLASTYASATNWFAVQHNSPNDYLDLIAGSNLGLPNGRPYSSKTLVDELHSSGIPWKGYFENLPSNCYNGSSLSDGLYDPNHNPFHYFVNSSTSGGGWCSSANISTEGVVPYPGASGLAADLDAANAPDFVFLVPNDCDEMHGDTSSGSNCAGDDDGDLIRAGDNWLQGTDGLDLPAVLASNWYAQNGIIIITWDESASDDNSGGSYGDGGHIPTIVISANSSGHFTSSGDHYATLRAIEDAYGVSPLLGNSQYPDFGDLTPAFGVPINAPVPTVTGVTPTEGAEDGGDLVTISGTSFNGTGFTTSHLRFGGIDVPATNPYPCPGVSTGCFTVDSGKQITAFTPQASAAGTVHITAETPGGISATNPADEYTYIAPGAYTAMTPFRICDTREDNPANQCTGHTLGPRATATLQVTGEHNTLGQTVPSNATAVAVNLTAVNDSTGGTYVTAFPTGGSVPVASNINLGGRDVQANLAIVQLSSSGQMSIFNAAGSTDAIVDVQGYFAPPSAPVAGEFHAMPPLRICDTRANAHTECAGGTNDPLPANTWRDVVLSGLPAGGSGPSIPSDGTAAAALFNLTPTQGTAATYLTVEPPNSSDACPTGPPGESNINIAAGVALPNRVVSSLGPRQDVCVYNSLGSIDFLIDVDGWFGDGSEMSSGALFYALPPTRICDTRTGSGTECAGKPLTANTAELVPFAGVDGLPVIGGSTLPVAVVANLTGVAGSAATYFTLYPSDVAQRPIASDLNPVTGVTVANLAIVGLATTGGTTGDVDLYNAAGTINAILDVAGWFQ
jgi:Phosphoesterase family/IPT/TIG domain